MSQISSWKWALQILGRISQVVLIDTQLQQAKAALTQLRDRASTMSLALRKSMHLIGPSHRSALKGAALQMIQVLASDGPQYGLSTTRSVTNLSALFYSLISNFHYRQSPSD